MSPGGFTERRTFPRNAGPAPHFWETDWQPTAIRGGFKRDDITEASLSQNCGPGPHFWETAPPLKNGQIRGQKHLEQPPKFFCSSLTYTKFTFCKKIGSNRPIQPSAVVRIFHCRSYGVPTTNWWSIQRANEQYRDHLVGQLTRKRVPPSPNPCCHYF